tara:strand:- start:994 stop:1734 length:741 start_codon:yes stop_codon:yes gene_type:complete
MQATQTNVLGSRNVIDSAISHRVSKVVCLSTDKAVYPINALGLTKALMEKVVESSARNLREGDTILTVVRYGNVLFSRGSVIPLFMKQVKDKRAISITEPDMTRFLLPLKEATGLVTFALENGRQGDIFIRKSPSCSIRNLAQAIKNIFKSDSQIKIIGMRHGEKLYETLASKGELLRSEDMGEYLRVSIDGRDLNYNKYLNEGDMKIIKTEDYNSQNTVRMKVAEIEEMLLSQPEVISELEKTSG